MLLCAASSLAGSWVMGMSIDQAAKAAPLAWIVAGALGYCAAVFFAAWLSWITRVRIERIAQAAMMGVKSRLFSHLLRHDVALHDKHGSGALLARVTGDIEAMRLLFSEVILQIPGDVALVLGMFVILGFTAPGLLGIVAISLPFWVGLIVWYRRVSPATFSAVRKESTALTGWMTETVAAIPLLRSMDRLDFVRRRTAALGQARFDAELQHFMQNVWFFNGLFGVRSAVLGAVVWIGAEQVARGELTAGVLLVAVDYTRKMVEPFMRLQFHITTLERARVGAGRVKELLDVQPVVVDPKVAQPWPGIGVGIQLHAVDFAYQPDVPILSGVNLHIPAGLRVGIVGPTGGGKSSLVQLLARFRDPSAGSVTVGGEDLRMLSLAALRHHVGLVTQSVQLLPGTVAENLGADVARAGVLLDEIGLAARLGPGTLVGAGGETLSRGEAQLLCVARALVSEPEILLLDEATSAMDPDTEAGVMRLLRARPGRTVVTVAHRLRTIVDHDVIVVFDHGIVEMGAHAELLGRGGVYAALWRAQLAKEGA